MISIFSSNENEDEKSADMIKGDIWKIFQFLIFQIN